MPTSMPTNTGSVVMRCLLNARPCRMRARGPGDCPGCAGEGRDDPRSPTVFGDPGGIGLSRPEQDRILPSGVFGIRYKEDEREPERVGRPTRFHLPLAVESQLLPEEKILSGQRSSRPEADPHEAQEIDRKPHQGPTTVNPRL